MSSDSKGIYEDNGMPVSKTPGPGQPVEAWEQTEIVGKSIPRVDGYDRVSGSAVYPSDVVLPDMLCGRILGCPHPAARVERVDLSRAVRSPGVHAVLGPESPEARVKWAYADGYEEALFPAVCRFEGEIVAAVAAETPYQASDALERIGVDYSPLEFVPDERDALEAGSPKVHADGNRHEVDSYSRGNVERGFAEADVVLDQRYRTACEIHTPLELHGCVARWDGDRLVLWESTQGVYAVQSAVAAALNLPLSRVRVIGRYMGGGFGSKLETGKYSILAALLARKTGRPVKLFLTREDTFLSAGNRPPANMQLKAGIKKDGTLTALRFKCLGTGGAYPSGGTSLVDWLVRDLYTCPNVTTEVTDVFINAGLSRPFRAPGHPQGAWALEQMIDALAEAIDMDPVSVRLKNIPAYSQAREGNPSYTTTGLKECLTRGAEQFEWKKARRELPMDEGYLRRGVGMAACSWFVGGGGPPSTVFLKLYADGSANLNMGASDIGTGTKTIMAMVAAEELGVRPEVIQIENADTGTTQYATPSGGSKTVPTEAPTVRAAAIDLKRQLLEMAAEQLDLPVAELVYVGDGIVHGTDPSRKLKISDIDRLKSRGAVIGAGHRGPNPSEKVVCPFAAQFCEVEVNMRTGEVKILRFLGVNESGRVMNRLSFDSQVIGGITMGIGLAQTEFRVLDRKRTGKMVNRNWHDYKLPTALDVPVEIVSAPIDMPDAEANTTGAKGLGEPVTIPTAAAVANAIYHATGIRCAESPINPIALSRLIAEQGRKE